MDNELEKQKINNDFKLEIIDKIIDFLKFCASIYAAQTFFENLTVGDVFSNNTFILEANTLVDLIYSITINFKESVACKPFCGQ